ncbi:MAG: hypothetical protein U5S82_12110 [Gammaproteobacteria bacterium]|nr:hypothetical protein [Gammaproteobacteria bacterium]
MARPLRIEYPGAFRVGNTDQALRALSKFFPVSVNAGTRYWVTVVEK